MFKFHPLTGIIYFIVFFTLIILTEHPVLLVVALIYLITLLVLTNNTKSLIRSLSFSIYPVILIIIINPIISQSGETIIFRGIKLPLFGHLIITLESIYFSLNMSLKIIDIFLIFLVFSVLTDRDDVFSFLSRYSNKVSLIISMAFNIIYKLIHDVKRVREVMIIRGVNFNQKEIFKKIKVYYPLFRVILISSLEGSIERAEALYSKGYGKGSRTSYYNMKITAGDILIYLNLLLLMVIYIHGCINKVLNFKYYPQVTAITKISLMYILIFTIILFTEIAMIRGYNKWKYLKYRI